MFKRKKKEPKIKKPRFQAFRDAYKVTHAVKPWIGAALTAIFLLVLVIGVTLGFIFDHPIYGGFVTLPLAALATMFFFTRVAGSAAYASIEGQIGAGASVLMAIRKGWTTTPAVAVNKQQDMVHRSVGRAGIVLTGEGGFAVRTLMQDEKRKMERFLSGVPITEVYVGDGQNQVSIRKLQKHLKKLPKKLNTSQLREVRARLRSVGGLTLPMPKGPLPGNARMPRR